VAQKRASWPCLRRHGNATIHLNAKKKSDPYQEYPEVLVGTKYIYDLGTFYIVTFHLKNIAHSLEPGETPSNSASHQAPNYVQRS